MMLPARRRALERAGKSVEDVHDDAENSQPGRATEQPHRTPDPEAMKALGHDTEAGRLLAKLYGKKEKPKIHYPKPKTRPTRPEDMPEFVPGGGRVESNPRAKTRSDAPVAVPKVGTGQRRRHYAPIEFRTGRGVMQKDTIEARRRAAGVGADREFAPLIKPVSTEAEKKKLATLFQFKGGKALPEELTMQPIEGHVPLSVMTGKARPKGSVGSAKPARPATPPRLRELETMFSEVSAELEERQTFLEEMRETGMLKVHQEERVTGEIEQRARDLAQIEAMIQEERKRLRG